MSFIILIFGNQLKLRFLSIESREVLCNRFHGAFVMTPMTRFLLSITNVSHCNAVYAARHKTDFFYFITISKNNSFFTIILYFVIKTKIENRRKILFLLIHHIVFQLYMLNEKLYKYIYVSHMKIAFNF